MKPSLSLLLLILSLTFSSIALGQTKRRPTTNRKPTPVTAPQSKSATQPPASATPASATPISASPASPTPARPTTPPAPTQIVVINGQTFTSADFDPAVRKEVESVGEKIAEARRSMLELEINTALLKVEAKKRRIDSHRLYETEVSNRATMPTPAQIKKFIDENKSQFEGMDPQTANQQVAVYLHDELESKLADDLVKRLRLTNPVVMGVDVNSPNLSDDAVLATVGGQPVKAGLVKERLKPIIYQIQFETYLLAKRQADQMVDNM